MNFNFNPNDLYTAALVIAAIVPCLRKYVPKLKEAEPVVVKAVEEGERILSDLAKTPWFASIAASTKLEVHHVTSKFEDTALGKVAATGLAAFAKRFQTNLDGMTPIQKAALSEWIKAEMANYGDGVVVTDTQVQQALRVAQAAVDKIEAEILPAVQNQVDAVNAWSAPVNPAPANQEPAPAAPANA